jgi:superfamily II DNA/RNA helicase
MTADTDRIEAAMDQENDLSPDDMPNDEVVLAAGDVAAAEVAVEEGFRDFGLGEDVLRALDELGYEAPTPVQRATIRLLMTGRDVIAQAQTGTGKTAAYGIPMVEAIVAAQRRPQGLVLAPTRELAVQVAEAVHQFGKHRGVVVLPIYGGQPMDRQLRALRSGVHIVVGTPGRILDHLRRGTLDLGGVSWVVLDEADEMLDMGFLEDVESILAAVAESTSVSTTAGTTGADASPAEGAGGASDAGPAGTRSAPSGRGAKKSGASASTGPTGANGANGANGATGPADPNRPNGRKVQSAMFSATMPMPVERLARRYLHDPVRISIAPEQVTVPQIAQVAYEVVGADKLDALARILDVETPAAAIIFCGTRRTVDDVADRLAARGFRSSALHGDMAQTERERVLRRFRDGQTEVLVATDVAARGLDIESVTHVVNFDIPWDPESYVHRIGRTGRAGRVGNAVTLVTPRDYRLLKMIERMLGNRITRKRLPSLRDLASRRREAAKEAVTAAVAAGDLDPYLVLAGELGDQLDPVEIAAAALRLWDQARNSAADGTTIAGALRAAEAEEQARQAERVAFDAEKAAPVRRPAREFEANGQAPETGMKRILVASGNVDGLRPQDLVGAIANEAGIPGRAVGAIDIYDRFSYVEVPSEHASRVVRALTQTTLRGRSVSARLADANDVRDRGPAPTSGPGGGARPGRPRPEGPGPRPRPYAPPYAPPPPPYAPPPYAQPTRPAFRAGPGRASEAPARRLTRLRRRTRSDEA